MSKSKLPSQSDNLQFLAAFMPNGTGIELQEKAGQNEVVTMDILPKMMMMMIGSEKEDAEPAYVQMGIQVLGEADDLFYQVKLPEGWHKKPMKRDIGSKLFDEKGRERLIIFYKAAYYDRKAHGWLLCRYAHDTPFNAEKNDFEDEVVITDGGREIKRIKVDTPEGKYFRPYHDAAASAWLNYTYPNWRDPFDYWND